MEAAAAFRRADEPAAPGNVTGWQQWAIFLGGLAFIVTGLITISWGTITWYGRDESGAPAMFWVVMAPICLACLGVVWAGSR
jgi:hypothetical protein